MCECVRGRRGLSRAGARQHGARRAGLPSRGCSTPAHPCTPSATCKHELLAVKGRWGWVCTASSPERGDGHSKSHRWLSPSPALQPGTQRRVKPRSGGCQAALLLALSSTWEQAPSSAGTPQDLPSTAVLQGAGARPQGWHEAGSSRKAGAASARLLQAKVTGVLMAPSVQPPISFIDLFSMESSN